MCDLVLGVPTSGLALDGDSSQPPVTGGPRAEARRREFFPVALALCLKARSVVEAIAESGAGVASLQARRRELER